MHLDPYFVDFEDDFDPRYIVEEREGWESGFRGSDEEEDGAFDEGAWLSAHVLEEIQRAWEEVMKYDDDTMPF